MQIAPSPPPWLCLPIGLGLGLGLLLPLLPPAATAARAQMSPNCERNGRREACAYTPNNAGSGNGREAGWLVFADNSVVEVVRLLSSCRSQGPITTCQATLARRPGPPQRGSYRGTSYEGGYRHDYSSPGLRFSFSVMD